MSIELKDLQGLRFLDAVDTSNEQVKTWGDEFEACEVIRFRLDGVVYIATENPSDGYRSSMRDLASGDFEMKNTFPAQQVFCLHRTIGSGYSTKDDVLCIYDARTARLVLEVGTVNSEDYYPSFVAAFHPEAMAINSGAA